MTDPLYTVEELVALIKAADVKLSQGFTQGRLETGMSEQEWRQSMAELRKQRDYYYGLWKSQTGNAGNVVALLPANKWII